MLHGVAFLQPPPYVQQINNMAKAPPNRAKAETLSLRISPNLKFGLELLSRLEERSLTTEVEKALGELFDGTTISVGYLGSTEIKNNGRFPDPCFSELLSIIYTIDAPTRLLRTAILLPRTLTQRDQAILSLVSDTVHFFGDRTNYFSLQIGYEDLLMELTDEYCRYNQPLDLIVLRRNWSRVNDVIDYAMENGHYPDEMKWI
jgi:hypothetical protein